MEANTTTLLPYVLDLLSRRPNLKCSIEELCEYMKDVVIEDVITPFGSLQRAVEFAIELGINIGILDMKEENYLVPFSLRPEPRNLDESFLPPSECRSVINRMAKAMRTTRAKTAKSKTRMSAKTKAKSRKRRCVAPKRLGTRGRPLAARSVKQRCTTKTTTRRRKQ